MKSRNVIGKRIIGVRQKRFYNKHVGCMCTEIYALVLEDGTEIRPIAYEREYEMYVDAIVYKESTLR